jgi:hypothetical protein
MSIVQGGMDREESKALFQFLHGASVQITTRQDDGVHKFEILVSSTGFEFGGAGIRERSLLPRESDVVMAFEGKLATPGTGSRFPIWMWLTSSGVLFTPPLSNMQDNPHPMSAAAEHAQELPHCSPGIAYPLSPLCPIRG